MPHVPLYVPEDAYDPDPKNAYSCVVEHIDTETGRLLDTIRELGLDENTYVIFTSDNGPWTYLKNHAGSAGALAEANPALVTSMDKRMQELDAQVTKNARAPWKKP